MQEVTEPLKCRKVLSNQNFLKIHSTNEHSPEIYQEKMLRTHQNNANSSVKIETLCIEVPET